MLPRVEPVVELVFSRGTDYCRQTVPLSDNSNREKVLIKYTNIYWKNYPLAHFITQKLRLSFQQINIQTNSKQKFYDSNG